MLTLFDRSVAFVSLDTHPANNALVVSYEIQVSLCERTGSQRELLRRTKRDQHLIVLDSLKSEDFNHVNHDKIGQLLSDLSLRILNKCPLLADSNQTVDDIQPHLLYLISRRHNQVSASSSDELRPPSSVSQRFQLVTNTHERHQRARRFSAGSARRRPSGRVSQQVQVSASGDNDTYSTLLLASQRDVPWSSDSVQAHLSEVDFRLDLASNGLARQQARANVKLDADQQLDGLYGDWPEKLVALASLRRLSSDDDNLLRLSSSRLLICALLRTLRDSCWSSSDSYADQVGQVRVSILLLIARLTSYADTYQRAFGRSESESLQGELSKELANLLVSVKPLEPGSASPCASLEQSLVPDQLYSDTLNLALIIVHNLFKLAQLERSGRLMTSLVGELVRGRSLEATVGLQADRSSETNACGLLSQLECLSKSLLGDLKLRNKTTQKLVSLARLLSLLKQVSIYREFVGTCARASRLADVLVELLAALQLSRPLSQRRQDGSEADPNSRADVVPASELLCLELELFGLINNLLLDKHLKAKLVRKNLLKYALRSLVVFLAQVRGQAGTTGVRVEGNANQVSDALARFGQTQILSAPLRCLYELTCLDQVRLELLKSRIVIKCLLDYLQAAGLMLVESLGESAEFASKKTTATCANAVGSCLANLQLDSSTIGACEYILCIWINLSARHEIPADFHGDLLSDCVRLGAECLQAYKPAKPNWHLVYLEAKLLRNLAGQAFALGGQIGQWLPDRLAGLAADSLRAPHAGYLLACEILWAASRQVARASSRPAPDLASPAELDLVNCLLETIDWRAARAARVAEEEQEDDLLLAATVYLHRLASRKEICSPSGKPSRPSLGAVELWQGGADAQLLRNSLCLLNRLMNHSQFLPMIAGTVALVDRLAGLMLDFAWAGAEGVGPAAGELLERLKQLDKVRGQDGARLELDERRFSAYNQKWLGAIRSSGRPASGPTADEQLLNSAWPTHLDFFVNRRHSDGSASAGSGATLDQAHDCSQLSWPSDHQDADRAHQRSAADLDWLDAPDVGVIDAQSMIEHLARG